MNIKKIPIADPVREFKHINNFKQKFSDKLYSGVYVGGDSVINFEKSFSKFINSKYAISTNSGTDALILSMASLGLKKGDEVLLPSFTFIATVESVLHFGLVPVFVDIDKEDFTVDSESFFNNVSKKSKAFISVHLFGRNALDSEVLNYCNQNNIFIIEDCAQSFGSVIGDKYLGTQGLLGAFSFFPSKTLGGIGDGGCVSTNSYKHFRMISKIKNHGQSKPYEHEINGVNSRLDSLNAFVLYEKIQIFDKLKNERNSLFNFYNKNISNEKIKLPKKDKSEVLNYYSVLVKGSRGNFIKLLASNGIGTNVYYNKPIHLQNVMKNYKYKSKNLNNTKSVSASIVSIPFFPFMTRNEKNKIVEIINQF